MLEQNKGGETSNLNEVGKGVLVNDQFEVHPIANLFPEMTESQFEELTLDIGKNGLQLPILTYGGKVVDGRHRLRACSVLGIVPKFAELEAANDESAEQSVISINLQRRHLTDGQKAIIAARLAKSSVGTNQHTAGAISQKQAAADIGISIDSLQRGKIVLKHGAPELIAAVTEGKLKISNAAKLAQLAKEDQSQLNFDDIKAIQEASKAINKAKFENRRMERIQEIEAKRANNKPLESSLGTFSVIYSDPPWQYMGELAVGYPCMSTQEICDMPINNIAAEDAVLFMWTSASLLGDALQVVKAWGFEFKTSAVWDKGVAGQGAYFRQQHEVLMICVRGNVPEVPYGARPASVLKFPRLEHSRKPLEMYQIIDGMYPELSKIELFCRGEPAQGWTGWGNECTQQSTILTAPINDLKQA
jgi:N6-adenosine-specific RNA methylase IME4/ParB-like chromosome segregation protein Spo0J